ncbi:hypothetical protein CCUS01_08397 [Colletotrichum cuscutae]|uniref:Uncharacterized protein n=1 Tax=Colletotrichum cuscutae TaxID=1209917 RepID=A0AAI9UT96_9PEZI|nr:hypothetical protein CCUS01_08397 [Colletotrichum cuscutae]
MSSRGDYLLFSCLAPSPLGDRSARRLFEWPVEGGTTHLDVPSQLSGSFTERGLSGGGEETGGMSPPPEHPTTPTIQPVPPRTASSLPAVLRVVLICEDIEVSNAGWRVGRLTLCAVVSYYPIKWHDHSSYEQLEPSLPTLLDGGEEE